MRAQIHLLVKEKKIYQDLYGRVTNRINNYKRKIMGIMKEASGHYEQRYMHDFYLYALMIYF